MQKLTEELEIQKDAQKVPDKVVSNDLGQKKVISDETIKLELRYFHKHILKYIYHYIYNKSIGRVSSRAGWLVTS